MDFKKECFCEDNFLKILKLGLRVTGTLARKNVSVYQGV